MKAMMNQICKHAEFYRAYVPRDRSPLPMTITLAAIIALWVFVYLVSAVGPQPGPQTAQAGPHATALAAQPEGR